MDSPGLANVDNANEMAVETEKKYRLTSEQLRYVIDKLSDNAADFAGEDFEENTIYGGGVLDEKNAILRIRKTQDKTILTFKRRIHNDLDVKQQIEHESEFSELAALREIVANLGFVPRLVYEKRRRTWNFRYVEIVLDELPFGNYMEIEGSIAAIREVERLLDLDDLETESETYPSLTTLLGVRKGEVIEARFPLSENETS